MFLQLYPSSAKKNWWCFVTDPTDFRWSCFIGKLTPVSTHLILQINSDPLGKKMVIWSMLQKYYHPTMQYRMEIIAHKRETIMLFL